MNPEKQYNEYIEKVRNRLKNEFSGLSNDDYKTMDQPDVFVERVMKKTGRNKKEIEQTLDEIDYPGTPFHSKKPSERK